MGKILTQACTILGVEHGFAAGAVLCPGHASMEGICRVGWRGPLTPCMCWIDGSWKSPLEWWRPPEVAWEGKSVAPNGAGREGRLPPASSDTAGKQHSREVHARSAVQSSTMFQMGCVFWGGFEPLARKGCQGPLRRTVKGFGRWVVSSTGCFCRWVDVRPPSGAA